MDTEKVVRVGVHTSHCCLEHGCKYAEPKCPVQLGTHDQEYPCESCLPPAKLREKIAKLQEELKRMETLEARLGAWNHW